MGCSSWRLLGSPALWYGVRLAVRGGRRLPIGAHPPGRRPVFTVHALRPDAAPHAIALTLDDGPDPTWTPMVLDVLARHGVPATFFVVGHRAIAHPRLVRRAVAAGHGIANHTMHHPQPFAARSARTVATEIATAQRSIGALAGPPRLFRAPGGGWAPEVLRSVADQGLIPVDWTVDTGDRRRPGTARIVASLLRCRPGDIALCHDGGGDRGQTVAALDHAIPRLRERGLTFVAL